MRATTRARSTGSMARRPWPPWRQLQKAHGLPVTGAMDKATEAALRTDLAAKGGAAAGRGGGLDRCRATDAQARRSLGWAGGRSVDPGPHRSAQGGPDRAGCARLRDRRRVDHRSRREGHRGGREDSDGDGHGDNDDDGCAESVALVRVDSHLIGEVLDPLGHGREMRERATGIEPAYPAWEAGALPLSYARTGRREAPAKGPRGGTRRQCSRRPTDGQTSTPGARHRMDLAKQQAFVEHVRAREGATQQVAVTLEQFFEGNDCEWCIAPNRDEDLEPRRRARRALRPA